MMLLASPVPFILCAWWYPPLPPSGPHRRFNGWSDG